MYDKDCCYTPEPCNPCGPCDPCASPVPPPIRPVVNIPGPNVQAQMCEVVGRVNECIDRWNHIQRNCYEALQHTVGAAVSNDVYYDRDEVGFERGYSENDSCPYSIVRVACVDKKGKPIHVKLMPAFGNTTNSGLVQSIQDVSFVTNANAIITATADAPWKGVARYMGAPMAGTPDGGVMCGGFNRHGALKIFGGDTDEDTLCCNQTVDMIGSVIPIIIDGAVTEQAKGLTEKSAICAIGYKSGNGEKVFFDCGKQDVQGMQGVTVANILKDMGCTTAIITAMGPGGMEYLGGLASNPVGWKIPANAAYWVVSKRPFDGWCNQFESSIAQLVQRVGSLNNSLDFIRHDVDVAVEKAEQALEMAQDNADKIAVIQEQIKEIEANIDAIEGRLDTVEGEIKTIQGQIAELNEKLEQEIKDRENGDVQLQANLDKEIADRKVADSQLQTNIETEKSERIAADAVLQGNINKEAIDRANADLKIEQNLNKEIVNRTEADQLLQDQINGLTTGDVPLPYVKKAGDTMTGDLQMEGSAVVKLVDGKTVKGAFYRDNGDVCVKSESGNVRILGAATLLTTADNGAGQLKIGAITIQQNMSGDVPHLDINVGTDAGAVYVNRNGIDGGTGELWVTEIHAPNELRLAPGTNVNAMDHRITGVADPVDDGDAVNKKYLDSHGPEYTLPVASATTLGGVKVGANLTITPEGVLNATGGGGGATEYVAGEGIVISGNTISTDPAKVPTKEELEGYLPLAGGTMDGNIKFKGDAEYIGATVNDTDHSIVIGSQGEGAIMGSVSAGHSQTQVDAVINANLNSKQASVQATRTTDGGSNVVIEAQDPDSANAVSVKVGAKAADVTGGTLSVYREASTNYVDVGANQLKFGEKGLIFGGGDGLRIISGEPSDGGSLFFNGTQKTAQFLTYKPQYSEAPTENHDLVNKEYVDGKAGGDYLPLAGGTMRGNINMGQNDIVQTDGISAGSSLASGGAVLTGDASVRINVTGKNQLECDGGTIWLRTVANMSNKRIVSLADPTNAQDAATKAYVDSKITGSSGGDTVIGTNYDGSKFTMKVTASTGFSISKGPGMVGGFLYVEVTKLNVTAPSTTMFTIQFSSAPPPLCWATNVFTGTSAKRNQFQDSLSDKTTLRSISHNPNVFTTGDKMLVIVGVGCATEDTNATTIAPLCVL